MAVTTSRKLAQVLGRKHSSVLDTIKANMHMRAFKYGHFTTRPYADGATSHGYEFLITRKGLGALAAVMRYNARERIADAYAGAWDTPEGQGRLALPAPVAETHAGNGEKLREAEATSRMYTELYEREKRLRIEYQKDYGRLSDLYNDLLWRMAAEDGGDTESRLASHRAFRERITRR